MKLPIFGPSTERIRVNSAYMHQQFGGRNTPCIGLISPCDCAYRYFDSPVFAFAAGCQSCTAVSPAHSKAEFFREWADGPSPMPVTIAHLTDGTVQNVSRFKSEIFFFVRADQCSRRLIVRRLRTASSGRTSATRRASSTAKSARPHDK